MDSRTLALALSTLAQLGNVGRQRPLAAQSIAVGSVCFALAVGTAIAAIGCAAVALWSFLQPYAGPIWTPLIVAVAFLVVSGVLTLIGSLLWSRQPTLTPSPTIAEDVLKLGEQLAHALPSTAELTRLVKSNAGTLAIAAAVAGLFIGTGPSGRGNGR